MKEYIIAMPVSMMKSALAALDEARRVHTAIDEEVAALPALNAVDHGRIAIENRKKALEAFEARKKEATEKALRVIDYEYNSAVSEIDRQTLPTGADITGVNEADFKLLEYGLVKTPVALSRIAAAHDTPAFRTMVQMYADKREWEGFTFHDSEATLRKFVDDFFSECRKAAGSPNGYYGMLLEHDTEIERQALASGLNREYLKGANTGANV